jgi:mono/diheme cytochrome c family protein/cytochrome c551/c552
MRKPWYAYLYVKSPIVKIILGILSAMVAVAVLLFVGLVDGPRMQAQTANWDGRAIEKGAETYANNCASCHGLDGKGIPGPALNSRYFFTQRLNDIGFTGSLYDYVELTVAAGRPSKANSQWGVMMATWGAEYGGPLRADEVANVAAYVMNWEADALQQTAETDPWIPFQDTPSRGSPYEGAEQAAAAPAEPRAPSELFVSMACSGCHILDQPQTDTNRGLVGPNFGNLLENAAQRVEGQSAAEYIHNSIVNTNAYIVDGYMPNIMPQDFAQRMSEEEINALVEWLLDPDRQP